MKAKALLDALAKKLETGSQYELAGVLGVTVQTLINWKQRDEDLSPLQVASALAKSRSAAVLTSQRQTIQPIVELYAINCCETARGSGWQVIDGGSQDTLYARGLKAALEKSYGIYVFYDSQGKALYVGKARLQTVWKEMNLAFNRKRDVQMVTLVHHPDRNQEFQPGSEKLRQPKATNLKLCDLAFYFSAYKVDDEMIEDLEALLVRGFPNDLLNIKMEKFASLRK
ncbi:hypothetical protein ASD55_14625 [Rhodanobacter sp. Root561]|uniref:hypothetical protein n=1 Tax=Rhodanobacter sp. Root561 TaxID=1736560 RepID=UPI0006FED011|nr:hypothetical protein [Rhodanobacter sp. Root561]KQZ68290.1 hypothetical protein ASD55_14625 [Rhodanobacter sp. Root561]